MARTKQTARKTTGGIAPRRRSSYAEETASERSHTESDSSDTDAAADAVNNDEKSGIRHELERILTNFSEFSGTFAFSKTYYNAPNPVISLKGLGTIGLPLSEREAKTLISHCEQAPFGMGERTVVNKEVRDTWEMDAKKVKFLNAEWEKWIQETVVKQVCMTLGVNVEASKPKAELYKLLVYEKGSHFLPHVDTEKTDGMFATLIVVLPSQFTGGDAHISHAGDKLVFNTSRESLINTSVLAWYTDVIHEIKPITGGYRLALAYNFLHTSAHFRPSLSAKNDAVSDLRQVMKIWKSGDHDLKKVIYQLDHQYSQANLNASALKGSDSDVFTLVDTVARELGFCLGLAHLELRLAGYAQDHGDHGYYDGWGRWQCAYDKADDEKVEFAAVESRTVTVENLVDAEGKRISSEIKFNDKKEAIPKGFIAELEHDAHDAQEYEGYMGNGAGSLERFYRRTALVLWPPSTRLGNGGGNRRAVRAFDVLQRAGADTPTVEELELFDYACQEAPNLPKGLTLSILSSAARGWKDLERWTKALQGFKGSRVSKILAIEEVQKAVKAWKWEKVSPSAKMMIENDRSNSSRLDFLSQLTALAENFGSKKQRADIVKFAQEMREMALTNMAPLDEKDMEAITSNALGLGGVNWVKKKLLPQILASASVDFLSLYAAFIFKTRVKLPLSEPAKEEDIPVMKAVIAQILDSLLSRLDFLGSASAAGAMRSYHSPPKSPIVAKSFLKLCIECDNEAVASRVIERLANVQGLADDAVRARTSHILLPVLTFLNDEIANADPKPVLPLGLLAKVSIEHSLKALASGKYTRENVARIINVTVEAGDAALVLTTIVPKLKSLPYDSASWKGLIEELGSRKTTPPFQGIALDDVLADLTMTYATCLTISPYTTYTIGYGYGTNQYKETLCFVMKMGGVPALTTVIDKLLDPRLSNSSFISSTLFPLIPELRTLASMHKLPLSSDPFAQAIRTIINLWVEKVLGPRPDQTAAQPLLAKLKDWSCTCDPCMQAKNMLMESADKDARLHRIGKPKRVHVEKMLNLHAKGAAVYQMIGSTPQGLLVTKADAIFRPSQWDAEQKKGAAMIKSIGSASVQKSIWGTFFSSLSDSMNTGRKINYPAVVQSIVPAYTASAQDALPASTAAPQLPRQALTPAIVPVPGSSATPASGHALAQQPKQILQPPRAPATIPAKRKATGPPETVIDLCTP